MNSRFGGAMLVVIGMLLGGMLTSYDRMPATAAAQQSEDNLGATLVTELRGIRKELTEINAVLHSGDLRVVPVINPEHP